jgi:hypothetical protein
MSDRPDVWHVMPINDLRPHVDSPDCWCKPTQDDECENVFIHHALDEREKYESGERKPS